MHESTAGLAWIGAMPAADAPAHACVPAVCIPGMREKRAGGEQSDAAEEAVFNRRSAIGNSQPAVDNRLRSATVVCPAGHHPLTVAARIGRYERRLGSGLVWFYKHGAMRKGF